MPKRNASRPNVAWTDEMNRRLLQCRDEAKIIHGSADAPRKENGRKVGYMEIMRSLFLGHYPELECLTAQNLRDKIPHAEKVNKLEHYQTPLAETYNMDVSDVNNNNDVNSENISNASDGMHSNMDYVYTPMNEKECQAFQLATEVLTTIQTEKGEMKERKWRTRNSTIPSALDILSVNKITYRLLIENNILIQIDSNEFMNSLWNVDCVIYAAVIGWFRANKIKCEIKTSKTTTGAAKLPQ